MKFTSRHSSYIVFLSAFFVSIVSYFFLDFHGLVLVNEDSRAHLDVARRVFDSQTPGLAQLGGIWLPLPHIIMFPFIWNETLWHTGLAGVIPSMVAFIFAAFFLYKFTKSFYESTLSGVTALIILLSSPNFLFIQGTPMTESFSLVFLVLTIFFFWKWMRTERVVYLFATGVVVFLSTLTRYEGWILPLVVGIGIAVYGWKRKWKWSRIEGTAIITETLACFGIGLWMLYSLLIFKNPLLFLNGEGSATWFAQYEAKSAHLLTKGNVLNSFLTYMFNLVDIAGIITCALALIGFVIFFVTLKRYKTEKLIILFILIAPILFNIYSLYRGSSVMWTQWLAPHKIYNVRYVLLSVPLMAILIGSIPRLNRYLVVAIFFLVMAQSYIFATGGPLVLYKDITQTSKSAREVAAAWVRTHPTTGKTLISAGANEVIIFESGEPIKNFTYEGNSEIWQKALSSPYPHNSRIIMGSVLGPQTDKVYTSLHNSQVLKDKYELAYSYQGYSVFDLKGESSISAQLLQIKSVDTMKSSRDMAGQKIVNTHYKEVISQAKYVNANYVTVDTPYDARFYPVLKAWANEVHKQGMNVWFRGNWSGWEGWFDFPKKMTRDQHLTATRQFILSHPEVFKDGDIFSACPECEYGGPGSPLTTGDKDGYKKFMLDELVMMNDAFAKIGKKVAANYTSMNPDVAKNVLDEEMVKTLGNVIVLDYYTKDIQTLKSGIAYFTEKYPDARIVLGEYGAPIPDINGPMNDQQQADFIEQLMRYITTDKKIRGANYWTIIYGSTAVINDNFSVKPAAEVVKKYYGKAALTVMVVNKEGKTLPNLKVSVAKESVSTNSLGKASFALLPGTYALRVNENSEYKGSMLSVLMRERKDNNLTVVLQQKPKPFIEQILNIFH